MYPLDSHQLTITWNVTALTISDEGLEPPVCRDCQSPLNIHQPEEAHPEHLLGPCSDCGAWYLIEIRNKNEAQMFDLPNVAMIHATRPPVAARKRPGGKRATKSSS